MQLLEKTVSQKFDHSPSAYGIGVELEVEGNGDLSLDQNNKFWRTVGEDSLRCGAEYILERPVKIVQLNEALDELKELTKNKKLVHSLRCSTHIHIDVRHLTLAQVYCVAVAYWLCERVLVQSQGADRIGNLHCLRAKDAEMFISVLIDEVLRLRHFHNVTSDEYRYSALNLAALRKFGSIEFRFLKCMLDLDELGLWARNLWSLVDVAGKFNSPREVLTLYKRCTPKEYLESFFSPQFIKVLEDSAEPGVMTDKLSFCPLVPVLYRLATALEKTYETDEDTMEDDI